MAFATVDVAKQFSDESFVAKIRGGVISKLTNRLSATPNTSTSADELKVKL
jgi:hypothetical protein